MRQERIAAPHEDEEEDDESNQNSRRNENSARFTMASRKFNGTRRRSGGLGGGGGGIVVESRPLVSRRRGVVFEGAAADDDDGAAPQFYYSDPERLHEEAREQRCPEEREVGARVVLSESEENSSCSRSSLMGRGYSCNNFNGNGAASGAKNCVVISTKDLERRAKRLPKRAR